MAVEGAQWEKTLTDIIEELKKGSLPESFSRFMNDLKSASPDQLQELHSKLNQPGIRSTITPFVEAAAMAGAADTDLLNAFNQHLFTGALGATWRRAQERVRNTLRTASSDVPRDAPPEATGPVRGPGDVVAGDAPTPPPPAPPPSPPEPPPKTVWETPPGSPPLNENWAQMVAYPFLRAFTAARTGCNDRSDRPLLGSGPPTVDEMRALLDHLRTEAVPPLTDERRAELQALFNSTMHDPARSRENVDAMLALAQDDIRRRLFTHGQTLLTSLERGEEPNPRVLASFIRSLEDNQLLIEEEDNLIRVLETNFRFSGAQSGPVPSSATEEARRLTEIFRRAVCRAEPLPAPELLPERGPLPGLPGLP